MDFFSRLCAAIRDAIIDSDRPFSELRAVEKSHYHPDAPIRPASRLESQEVLNHDALHTQGCPDGAWHSDD